MADLNISSVADYTIYHENVGYNPYISNGNFELVPSFTAATNTTAKFIDGTAAGSITNSAFYWALGVNVSSFQGQFDATTFHSGMASLKLSCNDTTGRGLARIGNNAAFGSIPIGLMKALCIPVLASTIYKISAWIKTNNAASGAVNGQWTRFDSSYTAIGSNFTLFGTNNGTQDWTLQTTTVTTGANDAYFSLVLNNNVAGNISDAWFDDITLQIASINNISAVLLPLVTTGVQTISGPKIWS